MVEFVITYFIIAIILSMLTSSLFFIILAGLSLFIFVLLLFDIWFLYFIFKLLRSKPATGRFVRVDYVKNEGRYLKNLKYKVAVYKVDERECMSVFPAEGLFGVYFYNKNKTCKLRLTKNDTVFDKYNIMSCVVWPLFGSVLCAALVYAVIMLVKFRGAV